MGKLLCEKNLRDVWCRNESVRAEIGQILHIHTHTHAAKLVVEICYSMDTDICPGNNNIINQNEGMQVTSVDPMQRTCDYVWKVIKNWRMDWRNRSVIVDCRKLKRFRHVSRETGALANGIMQGCVEHWRKRRSYHLQMQRRGTTS